MVLKSARTEPVKKNDGVNTSERYLTKLCEKSFLSLWSYPNLFRSEQKELCDLLVIFGDDILIFSDKDCNYPNTGKSDLDWERWFRRAVAKSANQVWRAEAWMRKTSDRVFLDAACTKKLPITIKVTTKTRFHLILVAHGASEICKKVFGGSGSMMFNTYIKGLDNHILPFTFGDLDPNKTFVHVLDDTTLDILLSTLDTISDFTSYLIKKEKFLRSGIMLYSTGEEELLAKYLKHLNKNFEHDFSLTEKEALLTGVALLEGDWDAFKNSPARLAQIKEDEISYLWDGLIEQFNKHALDGTQYMVSSSDLNDTEKALSFLAREASSHAKNVVECIYGGKT